MSSVWRSCLGLGPGKLGAVRGGGRPRPGPGKGVPSLSLDSLVRRRQRQVLARPVESLAGRGWAESLSRLCLGWGLLLIVFGL